MVRFGSVIKVVSVTSSSKQVGETSCLRNTIAAAGDEARLLELRSDRLMAMRPGCGTVFCQLAVVRAHAVQHPLADVHDQAGLLGERNELRGRDVAVPRQAPAQQRLGADHAAVAQIHLGWYRITSSSRSSARRSLLFSISRSTAAAFISGT
jgi:hypothetical protein